nr:unnamed protein product [Digitaria exilis]
MIMDKRRPYLLVMDAATRVATSPAMYREDVNMPHATDEPRNPASLSTTLPHTAESVEEPTGDAEVVAEKEAAAAGDDAGKHHERSHAAAVPFFPAVRRSSLHERPDGHLSASAWQAGQLFGRAHTPHAVTHSPTPPVAPPRVDEYFSTPAGAAGGRLTSL